MKIATKTITVVRTEMSEGEWATIRRLVAEGLTVVDTLSPAMQAVAEALHLNVADATPDAEPEPPPQGARGKAAKRPARGAPPTEEG